jgi:predicted RNase H-like nuclease (RuvC/YqgF family)
MSDATHYLDSDAIWTGLGGLLGGGGIVALIRSVWQSDSDERRDWYTDLYDRVSTLESTTREQSTRLAEQALTIAEQAGEITALRTETERLQRENERLHAELDEERRRREQLEHALEHRGIDTSEVVLDEGDL